MQTGHRSSVVKDVAPAAFLVAALLLAYMPRAGAHEALSGWSYPTACCSGRDCRQVQPDAVSEEPGGYVIEATGEAIEHTDPRVRPSPDGVYHRCSLGGADGTRTICLFVPMTIF